MTKDCTGFALNLADATKTWRAGTRNIQLKGFVKEPIISIISFFRPSLNGVLFPMFCLVVEGECQILVF